jgi:hypothetical protein
MGAMSRKSTQRRWSDDPGVRRRIREVTFLLAAMDFGMERRRHGSATWLCASRQ